MEARLDPFAASPEAMQAMLDLERRVRALGIEHKLAELVKIRASQINGCAYCLHMHTNEARASGESDERMHLLPAWRDSPLFSARERAALEWTEALTLIGQTNAPDSAYSVLKSEFSEDEQVKLTLLIVAINSWNRITVGFRSVHPVNGRGMGRPSRLPEKSGKMGVGD